MKDFSEEVDKAVDLLLKVNKDPFDKKKLFDKSKIVYLQVVLFQIPYGPPSTRKYLNLRHSLYGDDPEVCLFVPNRKTDVNYKKTTDELIDFCIDYYTNLLEKHKIKGITTIMPLKQLSSEYATYDLRRKLVHRFDLFLCKNSLLYNPRFLSALGKIFKVAKKDPLGISFPKEDVDFDPKFQKNIDRAINSSSFIISRFSDNYSIPFGTLTNTKSELKENLLAVLNQLFSEKMIPGGLKNIREMNLWPSQSKIIPFFINTELPVGMRKPNVKSRKKRKMENGVEGELSTQPNKKVFVTNTGEVFVTRLNKKSQEVETSESEGEDSFVDESGNEEENEEEKQIKMKSKKTGNEDENESASEDDEEIEKQETKLMRGKILSNDSFYMQSENSKETDEEEEEEEEEREEYKTPLNAKRFAKSKKSGNNEKARPKKKKLTKGKQRKGSFNKDKKNSIKS